MGNRPAPAYLRERLTYDPTTGFLVWRHHPDMPTKWNTRFAGRTAGCADRHGDGYLIVSVDHKIHRAHRIIWAMVHNYWPEGVVDHINGDRLDNRITNLRVVDAAENSRNARRASTNTSGVTGVSWSESRGAWYAYIQVDGRSINLGHHADFDDAVLARRTAQEAFGFHANHGRSS